MKRIIAVCLVICLSLCPVIAHATMLTKVNISQTKQADEYLFTFFDVYDENGNSIMGLNSDDVSMMIGAHEPKAEVFTVAESGLGIGYVFAVDISKSLTEKEFDGVRKSIYSIVSGMQDGDSAAILTFGEDISVLTDFTNDTAKLNEAIDKLGPTDKKTQLYNGILRTLDVAKRQDEGLPLRRVAVILSDGVDDFPTGATMTEVTRAADESGVPVYVVGVKGKNNQTALNELGGMARLSGGDLYLTDGDSLLGGYETVYERIQNGYVAGIELNAEMTEGSEQALFLTVQQSGASVEDSVDVRLKAVNEDVEIVPEVTLKPEPEVVATPVPQPKITPETISKILIGISIAAGIGALTATVIYIKRKNKEKKDGEKIADAKRRNDLDRGLGVTVQGDEKEVNTSSINGTTDLLIEDKTTPLGLDNKNGRRIMLCLAETKNNGERQYAAPLKGEVTVGRKKGQNDIVIPSNFISGSHCTFKLENEMLYIKDMGSTNGTFVITNKGPRRVYDGGELVKNGDTIRLGKEEFTVVIYEE